MPSLNSDSWISTNFRRPGLLCGRKETQENTKSSIVVWHDDLRATGIRRDECDVDSSRLRIEERKKARGLSFLSFSFPPSILLLMGSIPTTDLPSVGGG
jgi:hypothetical protein